MRSRTTILFVALMTVITMTASAQWRRVPMKTLSWFKDINFQTEKKGWIVGADGLVLRSEDGGESWTAIQKFTDDTIKQIVFTSPEKGWMLCERNLYSRGGLSPTYLRKTIDGGNNWDIVEFEKGGRERITRLLFTRNGSGTAVGEAGIVFNLNQQDDTWIKSEFPFKNIMFAGAFGSGTKGTIAGSGGTLLFSETSGNTWQNAATLNPDGKKINSVFIYGAENCWAAGSGGTILTSVGCKVWRRSTVNVSAELNDIYFRTARDGWIVGSAGTMLHTNDAGATWSIIRTGVRGDLSKIIFVGRKGYAIGFGGTLLISDDADARLAQ